MGRDSIRIAALALSEKDRAELAAELLASVEDGEQEEQVDVDAAWAHELEVRAQRADEAPEAPVALDEALVELRSSLRRK